MRSAAVWGVAIAGALGSVLSASAAHAVPSFARQTGMPWRDTLVYAPGFRSPSD